MKEIINLLNIMSVDLYRYFHIARKANFEELDVFDKNIMEKLKGESDVKTSIKSVVENSKVTEQKIIIALNLYEEIKKICIFTMPSTAQHYVGSAGVLTAMAQAGKEKDSLDTQHSFKEIIQHLSNVLKKFNTAIEDIRKINKANNVGDGNLLALIEKQSRDLKNAINDYLRKKQVQKYLGDLKTTIYNLKVTLQKYMIKRGKHIEVRLAPNIGITQDFSDMVLLKLGDTNLTKEKVDIASRVYELADQFSNTDVSLENGNTSWIEYVQPMFQKLKEEDRLINGKPNGKLNAIISEAVTEFSHKMNSGF